MAQRSFPSYFYETKQPKTGLLIRETHLVIQKAIRDKLRPHGFPPGLASILNALLHQDGVSQTELSSRMGAMPSQIVGALRKLEKAGYVTRKRNPEDRRTVHIFLTRKGRRFEKVAFSILEEVTKICCRGLSKRETKHFFDTLTKIRLNVLNSLDKD